MIEVDQANELFLKKKIDDAIKKYTKILENNPKNLIALNNIGYALSKLKKFDIALEYYDKSLEINPDDRIVLVNKISVLRKLEELMLQ